MATALVLIGQHHDKSGFKVLRVYESTDKALAEKDKEMLLKASDLEITIHEAELAGNL